MKSQMALGQAVVFALPWLLGAQAIPDVLPDESEFNRVAGQNIQPFYEGWQRMPDGHIAMWFGYLNRTFKELGDVPVGPNNHFDLRADLGQPAHFYPRRHLFVFKVDLPQDWPADKRLVWTVSYHGKPASASGCFFTRSSSIATLVAIVKIHARRWRPCSSRPYARSARRNVSCHASSARVPRRRRR